MSMKKILSFFAMLMAVISLQAQVTKVGDTFTEPGAGDQNNYAYTYRVTALPTSSADGKVEIVSFTRSGSSASSTQIAFGAVKETYSGSQKVFVVTKIGDSAFKGNAAMENFVLVYQLAAVPDVIEIGAYAFQGCSKLKSIRVGSGAWSSGQWSSYSYAKFGKIGDQAFYNCTALNMTISCGKEVKNSGTNVTYSIGANAF